MKRSVFLRNTAIGISGLTLAGVVARLSVIKSKNYSPYFSQLNQSLKNYNRAVPALLIDLDALDANIGELMKIIPEKAKYRIVVKSLPSKELVDYIMLKADTKRLMIFDQAFLSQISQYSDSTIDILYGKPMPVKTAEYYYDTLKTDQGFDPSKQLQWLVDTPKRIDEYIVLAKRKNLKLQLNIEIDVGLHRGGFKDIEALSNALKLIEANKDFVTFSGFMGYDAHIPKVPSILLSREKAYGVARDFYNACKDLVRQKFSSMWHQNLTFNGAGSPTVVLHNNGDSPLNDISAGSCLVMPTDFDIDTLTQFKPACYISTPVLKKYKNTTLPSLEGFTGVLNLANPNMENSYYIFGGSWMANYYQPEGINGNAIFGKSTNQVMINASNNTKLEVDDFVFLRPHQSEFVFLQFGGMLGIRKAKIEQEWSIFNNT